MKGEPGHRRLPDSEQLRLYSVDVALLMAPVVRKTEYATGEDEHCDLDRPKNHSDDRGVG